MDAKTPKRFKVSLEFLSENKVELTTTLLVSAATIHFVEAISPVNTHQTNHRQEDANTQTSRTLHVEGIELLGVNPCITTLDESKTVDGGVAQHERIAEFQREAVVGIGIIVGTGACLVSGGI